MYTVSSKAVYAFASPPAQAFLLHGGNHFPALEMRASVENHVFQEVGDALDVVRFIQGTVLTLQADAEPALGLCVRADEVGQPVGELSLDKPGILLGNACRRLDSRRPGSCFLLRLRPANGPGVGTRQPEWR